MPSTACGNSFHRLVEWSPSLEEEVLGEGDGGTEETVEFFGWGWRRNAVKKDDVAGEAPAKPIYRMTCTHTKMRNDRKKERIDRREKCYNYRIKKMGDNACKR